MRELTKIVGQGTGFGADDEDAAALGFEVEERSEGGDERGGEDRGAEFGRALPPVDEEIEELVDGGEDDERSERGFPGRVNVAEDLGDGAEEAAGGDAVREFDGGSDPRGFGSGGAVDEEEHESAEERGDEGGFPVPVKRWVGASERIWRRASRRRTLDILQQK